MVRRALVGILLFTVLVAFSACSGVSSTITSLAGITAQVQSTGETASTVQGRLGVGILKLEETGLAVTDDQAALLLPLWKAVKSLTADSNTSALEISSLYDQIEETLTTKQVQEIEAMTMSQAELNAAMQQYSVQKVQAASTSSGSASQTGQAQAQGAPPADAGMMAGAVPGGGMPGGEMMGGEIAAGTDMQASAAQRQTGAAAVEPASGSENQWNEMFAGTVVNLLQKRISG